MTTYLLKATYANMHDDFTTDVVYQTVRVDQLKNLVGAVYKFVEEMDYEFTVQRDGAWIRTGLEIGQEDIEI